MYVCVCKAVSDKAIRAQVAAGACSMRELKQCLGVGSQCGKCVPVAQQMLADSLPHSASAQSALAQPALVKNSPLHIPCQFVDNRPAA